MSIVSKPNTFSPNTAISSSQVNANFDTIYNDYNGGISAANIASNAITTAKIADDAVTTAKITSDTIDGSKINWSATGADAGIWWEELGRTTLSGTADSISVASLPARKYLMVLATVIGSGTVTQNLTFNSDTGNNYSLRSSVNGGADSTSTSQANLALTSGDSNTTYLMTMYIYDRSSSEKYVDCHIEGSASGAGTAPFRVETAGKWANTAAQISTITFTQTNTGDYASGSEVVVLGHN